MDRDRPVIECRQAAFPCNVTSWKSTIQSVPVITIYRWHCLHRSTVVRTFRASTIGPSFHGGTKIVERRRMASSEAGRGDVLSVYALNDIFRVFRFLPDNPWQRGRLEGSWEICLHARSESGILINSNSGLWMLILNGLSVSSEEGCEWRLLIYRKNLTLIEHLYLKSW